MPISIHEVQPGNDPVVLMDVDDVLVVCVVDQPVGYLPFPEESPLIGFYHPEYGAWLKEIGGLARWHWMTSKSESAQEDLGDIFDIEDPGYVDFIRYRPEHLDGNLNDERRWAIDAWFQGRPVAWIDDSFEEYDYEWAALRSANGSPTLIRQANWETGLVREDVDVVVQWLGQLAQA